MSNYKKKKMKEFDEKYPHQASIMFERDNVKEFISQAIDETEQRVKKEYEESKPTEYYKSKYLACMAKARNVSDCCGESIHISGEATHYYVCNKCLNACDIVKEVKE